MIRQWFRNSQLRLHAVESSLREHSRGLPHVQSTKASGTLLFNDSPLNRIAGKVSQSGCVADLQTAVKDSLTNPPFISSLRRSIDHRDAPRTRSWKCRPFAKLEENARAATADRAQRVIKNQEAH